MTLATRAPIKPTHSLRSHSASVARYPSLYVGLVAGYSPGLGATGSRVVDIHNRNDLSVTGTLSSMWAANNGMYIKTNRSNSEYLKQSNLGPLLNGTRGSVAAWIYPIQLPAAFDGWWGMRDGGNLLEVFYFHSAAEMSWRYGNGSSDIRFPKPDLNVWHHYVWLWNATSHVKVYRNGAQVASTSVTWTPMVPAGDFILGALDTGPSFYSSTGFDDFLIYNRELTDDEVQLLATRKSIVHERRPILINFAEASLSMAAAAYHQEYHVRP